MNLGALMLLYGIPFIRIRELRTGDLEQRPDGMYLAIDRCDGRRLRLAVSVAELVAFHL